MNTETKLVILMHPHEIKKVKINTGRFTALSFKDAEILEGVSFDGHERLLQLLSDEQYYPVLLYPREGAVNVDDGTLRREDLGGRRLMVIVIDATWFLAKKMMRVSPVLQKLPALMFTPKERSQWKVKRQPDELCLSTLEAIHQLMGALDKAGLGSYERPEQLLDVFTAVNDFQVACANDPARQHGRGRPGAADNEVCETGGSGASCTDGGETAGASRTEPAHTAGEAGRSGAVCTEDAASADKVNPADSAGSRDARNARKSLKTAYSPQTGRVSLRSGKHSPSLFWKETV